MAECAYCGGFAEGNAAIHRDGFCVGPQVPLCDEHGLRELPSCPDIWERIAERMAAGVVIDESEEERARREAWETKCEAADAVDREQERERRDDLAEREEV